MSPLSRADAVESADSAMDEEEALERALFEGRRRASEREHGPAEAPPLEAVLRGVDESNVVRVERSAGARAVVAVALAAACFMAALTKLPRVDTGTGSIAPDVDAGAPSVAAFVEHAAAATCSDGVDPVEVCGSEERACYSPATTLAFSPAASPLPVATFAPTAEPASTPPEEACGARRVVSTATCP